VVRCRCEAAPGGGCRDEFEVAAADGRGLGAGARDELRRALEAAAGADAPRATTLRVAAPDRPGLLASIAASLDALSLSVVGARITTVDAPDAREPSAVDAFDVVDADTGAPVLDPARLRRIEARLAEDIGDAPPPPPPRAAPAGDDAPRVAARGAFRAGRAAAPRDAAPAGQSPPRDASPGGQSPASLYDALMERTSSFESLLSASEPSASPPGARDDDDDASVDYANVFAASSCRRKIDGAKPAVLNRHVSRCVSRFYYERDARGTVAADVALRVTLDACMDRGDALCAFWAFDGAGAAPPTRPRPRRRPARRPGDADAAFVAAACGAPAAVGGKRKRPAAEAASLEDLPAKVAEVSLEVAPPPPARPPLDAAAAARLVAAAAADVERGDDLAERGGDRDAAARAYHRGATRLEGVRAAAGNLGPAEKRRVASELRHARRGARDRSALLENAVVERAAYDGGDEDLRASLSRQGSAEAPPPRGGGPGAPADDRPFASCLDGAADLSGSCCALAGARHLSPQGSFDGSYADADGPPDAPRRPPEALDDAYALGDALGRGSYGVVARGARRRDGAAFAVKTIGLGGDA
ncbi:hypothetical protein AURANDRAFT_68609, partial [Aureococcus anophagefferens]